jgi:hypothetical protein
LIDSHPSLLPCSAQLRASLRYICFQRGLHIRCLRLTN